MINNKKYKGFSLIEVMVLLTALSLILLAFLPLMIGRSQKTMTSDCIGGLRSVRHEFSVGNHNFTVPEKIASSLTVTLVGGGASGGKSSYEDKTEVRNYNSITYIANSKCANHTVTNCFESHIAEGQSAPYNCSQNKAGGSGKYYPKMRFQGNAYMNVRYLPYINSVAGETDYSNEKLKLAGGVIPLNLDGFNKETMGSGQGCTRDETSKNYKPSDKLDTSDHIIANYKTPTAGMGGASGAYAKFRIAGEAGATCNVTVGSGGAPGGDPQSGGDTRIQCTNDTNEYVAGGGQGEASGCNGGILSDSIPANGIKSVGTKCGERDKYVKSYFGGEPNFAIAGDGADSYLAKGGRKACDGETLTECQDGNGSFGMLGSGGGGGAKTESSDGIGGRGGDGIAIVEYVEYCK